MTQKIKQLSDLAAREIADQFVDGFFDDRMIDHVAAIIYKHYQQTDNFRWLITTNHVTAEEVKKYRESSNDSFSEAKHRLENRTEPVLQYITVTGEWRDVPVVVEYRNQKVTNEHPN
jgi:hypothetical protein